MFEIKKTNNKYPATGTYNQLSAVGQLYLYKAILSRNGAKVRLALVDNKIHKRTAYAFIKEKLPITLVEVQGDRAFIPYYGWYEEGVKT